MGEIKNMLPVSHIRNTYNSMIEALKVTLNINGSLKEGIVTSKEFKPTIQAHLAQDKNGVTSVGWDLCAVTINLSYTYDLLILGAVNARSNISDHGNYMRFYREANPLTHKYIYGHTGIPIGLTDVFYIQNLSGSNQIKLNVDVDADNSNFLYGNLIVLALKH